MKILVDVDDTVCKLVETWLWLYNKKYEDNLKPEDITDWDIAKFVKPEAKDTIFEFINNQAVYRIVPEIEGALSCVNRLRAMGHRVIFATWAMEDAAGAKYRWLKKHGFLDSQMDYVECKDKSLIRADITIDDNFEYVQKFYGMAVLFRKPWNMKADWNFCVNNWDEFVEFVVKYDNYWTRLDD